jgi:hypothetical protein
VGLPSWAPDWGIRKSGRILSCNVLSQVHGPRNSLRYTASGNTAPQFIVNRESRKVTVKGIKVDSVSHRLRPVLDPQPTSSEGYTRWLKEISSLTDRVKSSYPNKQSRHEAFWRTLIADRTESKRPAPTQLSNYYVVWKACLELKSGWPPGRAKLEELNQISNPNYRLSESSNNLDSAYPILAATVNYGVRFKEACGGRRFCITQGGYMALVPPLAQAGNLVCVILGVEVPYLLRLSSRQPGDSPPLYELVGECYVHGIMDGEKMDSGPIPEFIIV